MVFPGMQGGPLMHVIAAKAIAFREAASPEFKAYQEQVLANAKVMAETFMERNYKIVSGGTDDHLFLVDFIEQGYTGKDVDNALGQAHITVNKNTVPNDPRSSLCHQWHSYRHPGRDHTRFQGRGMPHVGQLDVRYHRPDGR